MTDINAQRTLSPKEIRNLSSAYIQQGRVADQWQFDEVSVLGAELNAKVSMTSVHLSTTDPGGFHLSVFSALEISVQMAIILGNVRAGKAMKNSEAWLTACEFQLQRPIRSSSSISASMKFLRARQIAGGSYVVADVQLSDSLGGLFTGAIKGTV